MHPEQSSSQSSTPSADLREALAALEKDNVLLSIHDASFPAEAEEDSGRGTPYGRGGGAFLRFARSLGFNGVQLGPQGMTTAANPSPYDGTVFSRNVLSIALAPLMDPAWGSLLDPRTLRAVVEGNPRPERRRVAYGYVWRAHLAALDGVWHTFQARRKRGDPSVDPLVESLRTFRVDNRSWLGREGLFEALWGEHGTDDWRAWPEGDRRLNVPDPGEARAFAARRKALRARWHGRIGRWAFLQHLAHAQHARLRDTLRSEGMTLFGDLQIGLAPRDVWALQGVLLPGWRMGAPPSRTNTEGQPWGYALLDPGLYRDGRGGPGPALRAFTARLRKALAEYDGLRLDHPHGLVCPWVYPADASDPQSAVREGSRLFESPDRPGLRERALVREDQLDGEVPRHADGWVRSLEPEQLDRYAVLLDAVMEAARENGRGLGQIACEVLSTQPRPLAEVMARYGLGRFRVTQKARLDDPGDVYRSENAQPADWIMVGNHDTPSIWGLAESWMGAERATGLAAYLARSLRPGGGEGLARAIEGDPRALVHALFADLFASRARNVMIFFSDLMGLRESYNAPGTVSEENWSLRVPPDWARSHPLRVDGGEALDLPFVLALALRARGEMVQRRHQALILRLEAASGDWARSLPRD